MTVHLNMWCKQLYFTVKTWHCTFLTWLTQLQSALFPRVARLFFYYHSHLKALCAVVFILKPHMRRVSCKSSHAHVLPWRGHLSWSTLSFLPPKRKTKSLPRIDAFNVSLYLWWWWWHLKIESAWLWWWCRVVRLRSCPYTCLTQSPVSHHY